MRKILFFTLLLLAVPCAAQVNVSGSQIQIGGSPLTSSGPYLHIPYYTVNPSGASLGADSVATTDGAGNFSFGRITSNINVTGAFPANNSSILANWNISSAVSSWTGNPTGLYVNIEDSTTDATSNATLSSAGAYYQVYHNGNGKLDSLQGPEIDVELCGLQACTGSLNAEYGFGGAMHNNGGTVSAGLAWDASENDGIQGFHIEYSNSGTTDYITDITALSHVALATGSSTNTVAGIHIFNNILPGSGVTLPNLYGIYINPLQGKATSVYGIYSEGTEPSFFGGKVQAQSMQVTGCAAATYVKADGSGCASAPSTLATVAPTTTTSLSGAAGSFLTTTVAGQYRVCAYFDATVAATAGFWYFYIQYTGDAHSFTTTIIPNTSATTQWTTGQGCFDFYADTSTSIGWGLGASAVTGTPTVRYTAALEQLQ